MRKDFTPVLLSLTIVCSVVAQPVSPPAACSLSGQSAQQSFDPSEVEFLTDPKPLFLDPKLFSMQKGQKLDFSAEEIARVVSLSPLILELWDVNQKQIAGSSWCQIVRLFDVDSRLRSVLPQLHMNDLVYATMLATESGLTKSVLTTVERIEGAPRYFHESPEAASCRNRAGTLLEYAPRFEGLALYDDLTISYGDRKGKVFDHQKLSRELLERLMRSFNDVAFNAMPGRKWTVDNSGQPSITLICGRYQKVPLEDHAAALAPVLQVLHEIRDVALKNTYYLLSYKERRELELVDWPLPDLRPEQVEELKPSADAADRQARFAKRPIDSRYASFGKHLPQDFLDKVREIPSAMNVEDAYVRSGSRLFLLTKNKHGPQEQAGTLFQLRIQEVLPPEKAFINPLAPGLDSGCATPMSGGVLRPSGAGVALQDVPATGLTISNAEYAEHESLYGKIFEACGGAFDVIEGNYLYKKVQLDHLERDPR
jgi:hypothetical protein